MNRTDHYGLPLFEANDKPSILVDWNETMAELDNALFTIATGGDTSVVDAITALQQAVDSINSQITAINQTLGYTLDTSFMSNIATQFESTGVEYNPRDMVFHDGNLYICFTQYLGIQDDEEHFDQYFIPVWLAQKVTDNLNDVDSLKTRMTSAESSIVNNGQAISLITSEIGTDSTPNSIKGRITTLENAPAPSGGSISVADLLPDTSSSQSTNFTVNQSYLTADNVSLPNTGAKLFSFAFNASCVLPSNMQSSDYLLRLDMTINVKRNIGGSDEYISIYANREVCGITSQVQFVHVDDTFTCPYELDPTKDTVNVRITPKLMSQSAKQTYSGTFDTTASSGRIIITPLSK